MYETILVPLDGSELAAMALPYVEALAVPFKSTVHLIQVVDDPARRSGGAFQVVTSYLSSLQAPRTAEDIALVQHPIYKDSEMASLDYEAKRLLVPIAERLQGLGIATEVAVGYGKPAGAILNYAKECGANLIVMCTHGAGGPDPYAFGPTADRVARRAPMAVMLIRPEEVSRALSWGIEGKS